MHIVVCCATQRGLRFIQKLKAVQPDCDLTVFSFPEEPWEPRFLDEIRLFAQQSGSQFFEGRKVDSRKFMSFWDNQPVDLLFLVNWRYMVPHNIFSRPRLGSYVFHDSLLPAYRGFSPTVWAIINGENHTGVTLFEIAEAVDQGGIVAQKKVPIGPHDTIAHVLEQVTQTYLCLLEENIQTLMNHAQTPMIQDESQATYTVKRLPQDNHIDWRSSTLDIYNLIRAVTVPYSGAFTYLNGEKLIIWEAQWLDHPPLYVGRIPGAVASIDPHKGVTIATGDGTLLITKVQKPGGPIQFAPDAIKSYSVRLS